MNMRIIVVLNKVIIIYRKNVNSYEYINNFNNNIINKSE